MSTARQLVAAFGLEGDERIAFEAAARGDRCRVRSGSANASEGVGHNLPVPATDFIGRTTELAAVGGLLERQEVRLLTLAGAGGTGKTRLAIEVARAARDRFGDCVFFVPLAPITDWRLLISPIAGAIGLQETGDLSPAELVRVYLRERASLLVLDNFEHLLPAALTVGQLLADCPALTVLVTSRAPLHLSGEQLFPVPPMLCPTLDDIPAPSVIDRYDATALFVRRARAVDPSFQVTPQSAPDIVEICSRLDGLPLAIELAAARVSLLPPAALRARLGSRIALLADGPRDAPLRQQTLWNTIDWSFQLLSAGEQEVFAGLSVFAGGCDFVMAEAVCVAGEHPGFLAILAGLVDKSLLIRVGDKEPRLAMLQTIREYAGEKLSDRGQLEPTLKRHAECFLELAEAAAKELHGPHQVAWLARLESEHDNLRAAFAWLHGQEDRSLALRLASSLAPFWSVRGYWEEGTRCLESALAGAADVQPTLRAQALANVGWLLTAQADFDRAAQRLDESLCLWRELGDVAGVADALRLMGNLRRRAGDLDAATGLSQEGLKLARAISDIRIQALALSSLSVTAGERGEYESATRLADECLALCRLLGDTRGITSALGSLGNAESSMGNYDRAEACHSEALEQARVLGDFNLVASCLHNLGFDAMSRGNLERSQECYTEALASCGRGKRSGTAILSLGDLGEIARRHGDIAGGASSLHEALTLAQRAGSRESWEVGVTLDHLARVAELAGMVEAAVTLWGTVSRIRESSGILADPMERRDQESAMLVARARLDDAGWAKAWEAGRSMMAGEAVEFGLTTAGVLLST